MTTNDIVDSWVIELEEGREGIIMSCLGCEHEEELWKNEPCSRCRRNVTYGAEGVNKDFYTKVELEEENEMDTLSLQVARLESKSYKLEDTNKKLEERTVNLERIVKMFVNDTRAFENGIKFSEELNQNPYTEKEVQSRIHGLNWIINTLPEDDVCRK